MMYSICGMGGEGIFGLNKEREGGGGGEREKLGEEDMSRYLRLPFPARNEMKDGNAVRGRRMYVRDGGNALRAKRK